jgi:lysophospholipase L1-like esterase
VSREPAPGERRILAVGDSNTLGWAGPDGANWPRDLDQELSAEGANVTVINAGVWGYSSAQGLARLEESLVYRPELVLISFGSNDAHRVSRSDREFAAGSQWLRQITRWLTQFRLGQLVAVSFHAETTTEPLVPRVPLGKFRQNLERMAAMARVAGAEPVFLTRPFTGTINDPLVWKNYAFDYNAVTVETAERKAVMVVDLYSYFKGRPEFFTDESHFTPEGHGRAAKIVADHLRPYVGEAARE